MHGIKGFSHSFENFSFPSGGEVVSRRSLAELTSIPISGRDWAAAARRGGKNPRAVKARFIFTTPIVFRAVRNTSGTSIQSSCMRAMCAASMATSVPAAPMATPTSAWAKAGASFTPSPASSIWVAGPGAMSVTLPVMAAPTTAVVRPRIATACRKRPHQKNRCNEFTEHFHASFFRESLL